jgi:hypothetical protein
MCCISWFYYGCCLLWEAVGLPCPIDLIHNMLLATSLDLKLSYEFWFAIHIGWMP